MGKAPVETSLASSRCTRVPRLNFSHPYCICINLPRCRYVCTPQSRKYGLFSVTPQLNLLLKNSPLSPYNDFFFFIVQLSLSNGVFNINNFLWEHLITQCPWCLLPKTKGIVTFSILKYKTNVCSQCLRDFHFLECIQSQ